MQKFIDYWIPLNAKEDHYKFHLIITSVLVSAFMLLGFIAMHLFIGYYLGALIGTITTISLLLILPTTKAFGKATLSGNHFAFQAYITILLHSLFTSDYLVNAELLVWLAVAPISGFLYANYRSGSFWLAIATLTLIILYTGEAFELSVPNHQPRTLDIFARGCNMTGFLVYLFVMIRIFENQKNKNIHDLNEANLKINQRNEEINQQNDEIKIRNEEINQRNEEITLQQEEILAINEQLESKNLQMRDSIRYAKTIQNAILPFEERVAQAFGSTLVIYKAKDIVSGDFYWLEQHNGKTFVALGDCTGHGVPGAFMSIIGYSILNDLILAQGIEHPARILEAAHESIRWMLKQEQQANSDGMDIALCSIEPLDNDHVSLTFAGARLPMLYAEPDKSELIHIKGTRKGIGGYQGFNSLAFQEHTFKLPKGSTIYFFSDGFVDQNNIYNKKYGSKRLREYIHKIHTEPLIKQKELLLQSLNEHMEGTEQRDDITLLAFQV